MPASALDLRVLGCLERARIGLQSYRVLKGIRYCGRTQQ